MKKLLLLLALAPALVSATLPSPTSASFAKGAKFTVAGYAAGKPALSGFPVLVRIAENSPSGFSYADLASSTGDDLCFIDMEGNGLPFEIDTWNPNSDSFVWVRLPTMTNGAEFVMCWGGGTNGKNVCNDNPFSNYVGVWHMKEASGTVADSSGNGFAATPSGPAAATACVAVSGPVGNGRQCSTALGAANLSYLSVPSYDNSKHVGDTFAVSGWFNIGSGQTGSDNDARLFSRKENYQDKHGWEALWKTGKEIRVRGAASSDNIKVQNLDYAGQGWMHFFIVYNGKNSVFYENGVQKGTKTNGTAASENGRPLAIGGYANDKGSQLLGSVDECRLLDAVPGADWAWAEYASMADAAFLTAGEAQSYGGTFPPSVSVAVTDRQYTNAAFTVSVGTVGTGATSADVSVRFAATDDFASPLWTTNYTVTGADAQIFSHVGLSTGTTYYVQAEIENDQNESNTSPLVSFTTLAPGAPVGTATFMERGFSTLTATATATDFGIGAEGATLRLEASTDGFATIIAEAEVPATIGTTETLSVSGLAADTPYALRVRIRNDWGLDAFVALPDTATRAVPFATTGIGWTFSQDGSTIDIDFGVSGVYDGTAGTATLTYNGQTVAPAKTVSEAGTLTWPAIPAATGTATATIVLSTTLAGQTYSQTFSATITPGSAAVGVLDIMDHASAATAVRVRPGDVVTLPELSGNERYIVGNKLFGSLEGNVLTALRPGILGIHCVGNDGATNTLAVLVLPEKVGNGNIYIFKDERIKDGWGYWNEAANWEKLGSETNDSFPHEPDDIAIVAYYRNTGVSFDARDDDIELAELYAGGYRDDKATITLRCATSGKKNKYSFRRTDGKPVLVQLCSNSTYLGNNTYRTMLALGNNNNNILGIEFLSDTILSGGWDGTDPSYPQGRFDFSAPTNRIADGVTVELREMDSQPTGNSSCTLALKNLVGGGTFWNRSSATVFVQGDSGAFTGLLRDSGHGAGTTDRTGPTFVRTTTTTNCQGEVVGWVPRSGSDPSDDFRFGAGCFQTGGTHSYSIPSPHDPWFTKKGFAMHGGLFRIGSDSTSAWEGRPDKRLVDFFRVGGGFNYIYGYNNNANHNIAWFETDTVSHEGTATLRIRDQSLFESANTNIAVYLHGISQYAVGAGEDPKTSNAASIVPWIVAQAGSKQDEDLRFAAFDANDRLSKVVHSKTENVPLSNFGQNDNAYIWKGGVSLSADATVNSLSIVNEEKAKQLGEGRTLTITSGGLILGDISWLAGASGIGTQDGGAANGALVLGDATHPAYVWARGADTVSAKAGPNEIWAPVTAPGGFVAAYTGSLLLGGDQTGIADELVVNAGTLQLGTTNSLCKLTNDLPIRIYANATLRLPNATSTKGTEIRFDGAAGWFGKVDIAAGVEARCRKLCWRDYPETPEWQYLPSGTYGSSDSDAEFVRDDLFTGAGVLTVSLEPTLILMR